jgi:hypothetical protein
MAGVENGIVEHFGERLRRRRFGHRLTREGYAYPTRSPHARVRREQVSAELWDGVGWAYQDEEHTRHSDTYLLVQRDQALVNYDLSMQYFESLDDNEFHDALARVLASDPALESVSSLPAWHEAAGVYVMVFDKFRQFYVGQAVDIRKRVKQHWNSYKPFDRLVFGSLYNSIFPVDALHALDTTRIYALRTSERFEAEARIEDAADRRFCLNRMMGGEPSPFLLALTNASPRTRSHRVHATLMELDDFCREDDCVTRLIEVSRSSAETRVGNTLASLDMSIYSVSRPDGTRFLWSKRDSVRAAAARGDLTVHDYVEFLTALGETVIWP